jgi:hypothetical protein
MTKEYIVLSNEEETKMNVIYILNIIATWASWTVRQMRHKQVLIEIACFISKLTVNNIRISRLSCE